MLKKIFTICMSIMLILSQVGMISYAENIEESIPEVISEENNTEDNTEKMVEEETSENADIEKIEEQNTEEENAENIETPESEERASEEKVMELKYEGEDYTVTISSEAGFDKDSILEASIIDDTDENYESYSDEVKQAMKEEGFEDIDRLALYDISILKDGKEIEPEDTVSVNFEFKDSLDINIDTATIVHLKDEEENEIIEIDEISEASDALSFEAESFSVYAIVEGVYVEDPDDRNVHQINEIDGQDLYIYGILNNVYYAKDGFITVKNTRCLTRSTNDESAGVLYHFTKVPDTENQFYIQHSTTNQYLCMDAAGNMSFNANSGTAFIIEYFNEGVEEVFYIYRYGNNNNKYCINMKGGDNATGGFGGSTYKDNGSRMMLLKPGTAGEVESDPYGINNKTYGIILNKDTTNEGALSAAMMSEVKYMRFTAQQLLVKPDPSDETKEAFVYIGDDISLWTFHYDSGLNYYISTEIDGQTKYICLNRPDVSLVDEVNDNCLFKIESDEDIPGKYRFVSNRYALSLRGGSISNGFGGLADDGAYNANQWFNLAEPSQFTDDTFTMRYCAHKISISDDRVTNGTQVIVYTRVWNADKERYEFWAIDHNGSLVPCYNVGSEIWWQSGPINTMIWEFTEYYYEGTTDPNYYYELQNVYSEKYLAPQIHSGGQVLSNSPIGINLNGRRYDDYYSKILAWDDPNYDYAGYVVEDGQLKVVPMSKAGEFYFAIPDMNMDSLSTISTVDNNSHGIDIKMTKYTGTIYGYNGTNSKNRNRQQTEVLGSDTEAFEHLVTTDLKSNGYPDALITGQSLSALFANGQEVNHLFSLEKYNESGYFEYDCTQNFAYLNSNGDFTVYNNVASFDTRGKSSQHGQFMPYDALTEGEFSTGNYNMTDVVNNELPDSDPRKGMSLYNITRDNAHYFFGMEMSADFMQTPSGCDQFGNDLIFEFSGDDDMWLYIDGELILDLGGVHSAFTGNINYKTGSVHIDRSAQNAGTLNTTLRAIFEENYRARYPNASDTEVNNYLNDIFDGNTFKDYTAHSMKMLYMERGAGSSNLRMRFNLTTVEDGEVFVGKEIVGTDKEDYLSLEFPYAFYYKDPDTNEWMQLEQAPHDEWGYLVTYKGERTPVESPDGKTFYLRPGEFAEIHFLSDDIEYKIVELDVDTSIYDHVYANNVELEAEPTEGDLANFGVTSSLIGNRKQITFENHVNEESQRSLLITKRLFDEQGNPLHKSDDPTTFRFRIYLGKTAGEYGYYRLGSYYVKDANGNYCKYVSGEGFVSIGKQTFSSLTEDEIDMVTFTTSPSGAVDKIPADYSVEIRGLLVGAEFKVEEQESDIPKGYSLGGYTRVAGTYIIEDGDTENSGIIRDNANPHIEVNNSRGWGLTVVKSWTDETFMASHDTIYLGVYYNGSLIPNTLREYTSSTNSLYWYFDELTPGATFSDYEIREVVLDNPVVNDDGYVTSYDSAVILEEGDEVRLSGRTLLNENKDNLRYIINYEVGELTGVSNNLREDTVINMAEGLRITKTDMSGNYISGGTFTLKNSEGEFIGSHEYTAKDGLITTAYLPEGTYTLSETVSPKGYHKLFDDVSLTVDADGNVSVSGSEYCIITEINGIVEIQIKNRKNEFTVVKMNEALTEPLPGTVFALYREVASANGPMKDYRPLEGYENLVVDSNGIVPLVNINLRPGTYYLEERNAVTGYIKGDDIKFTLSIDYVVTLDDGDAVLEVDRSNYTYVDYIIKIKNKEYNRLQLRKTAYGTGRNLPDAVFELYKSSDFNTVTDAPMSGKMPVVSGTTNSEGVIGLGNLPNGTYYLREISPPSGYTVLPNSVKVVVTSNNVTVSGSDMASVAQVEGIYEINIQNKSSSMIPTGINYASHMLILLIAALFVIMALKKLKK